MSTLTIRRCDANNRTPEENLIHLALELLERMPADERLSMAIASLSDAKRHLADYIDGIPFSDTP